MSSRSHRIPFSVQKGFERLNDKFLFWLAILGVLFSHVSGWTAPTFSNPEIPTSIVSADFNGDGFDDIAIATSGLGAAGKLYIFFSNTTGDFNQTQVFDIASSSPLVATIGNYRTPNRPDISVLDQKNHKTYTYLNDGSGNFSLSSTINVDPSSLAAGNFRGNGKRDLVFANPFFSVLTIFYGNGDGTFTPGPQISTSPQPTYVTTGDLNNDGFDDIVVSYAAGDQIKVFINDKTGNFTEFGTYPVGTFPTSVVVGDLTNNGFNDIVVTNGMSNNVSVLRNRGTTAPGTFQNPVNYPVDNFPISATLANFHGGNTLDIAVANEASSTVSVLTNNGDGTFQNAISQKVGSAPLSITSGRYTTNPLPTYITANAAGGNVTPMPPRATSKITLVQSSPTTIAGEPVTFTATVIPTNSNAITGSVTFLDGTTVLATVPITINGGTATATFTTSSLSTGPHIIKAAYSGNANFEPSESNTVTHIVIGSSEPTHLRGKQAFNIFVTQTDIINILTWKAPSSGIPPVSYRIYRNRKLTKLAAEVRAHKKNRFRDHNRKKGVAYTYFVVAVDVAGQLSQPARVTVEPRK